MQIKNLKVFLLSITTAMTLAMGGCSNKKIVVPNAGNVKVQSEAEKDSTTHYENVSSLVVKQDINNSETCYQVTVQKDADIGYDTESFEIAKFQELKELVQKYPNLERFTLYIKSPGEIGVLKNIQNSKKLKSLTLFYYDIEVNLENIEKFSNLERLTIYGNISNLDFVENLKELKTLILDKADVNQINQIGSLKKLEKLTIRNSQITSIQALEGLENLTELDIADSPNLCDISVLNSPSFQKIESLNLDNTKIGDIYVLKNLSNLNTLYASMTPIADISVLSYLPNITTLHLNTTDVTDIQVLENLPNLRILNLSNNNIKDFSVLKSLTELENLTLENTNFIDMNLLANNAKLKTLNLSNNHISNVSILLSNNFSELESVSLYYNDIPKAQFDQLEKAKVINMKEKTQMASHQKQAILSVTIIKEEKAESLYNISFIEHEDTDTYDEEATKTECVQLDSIEAVKEWIEARKGIISLSCDHIDSSEELQILDAIQLPEVLANLEITKSTSEEIVNHLARFYNVEALTINNVPIPNVDFLKDMKKLEMLIMNAVPKTVVTTKEVKQYQDIKWVLLTGFEKSEDIILSEACMEQISTDGATLEEEELSPIKVMK